MTTTAFEVSAIPPSDLRRLRERGADDFGNPLVPLEAGADRAPLRCCLRDARPGERIALVAYRPPHAGGPYAEVGPVFVHADPCPGYAATGSYPEGFRRRRQLLRAYGHDGRQVENVVVEGADAEAGIAALLRRPEVDVLHSRNLLAGCYMFSVRRAGAPAHGGDRE